MKNKIILCDVDGCLLNWEFAFSTWVEQHGFQKVPGGDVHYDISKRYGIDCNQAIKLIKIFNESAAIGFLPPLRDAMYYVKRLHEEHGFLFKCITSLSADVNARKLREMNLKKLFGETAFDSIVCLATGAEKDSELELHRDTGCYWIEDLPKNVLAGHNVGLQGILMEHGHNLHFYHKDIPKVKNWKEVYSVIIG